MGFDLNKARTAKDVIDDAIQENNSSAWLLYGFAISFVMAGLVVLATGIVQGNNITSILGVCASLMFWPSMSIAIKIRKENIAIRVLEVPLSQSSTSEDAAKMLNHLVEKILHDGRGDER